jgi:ABC-type amino acid transport substrate-binding protein
MKRSWWILIEVILAVIVVAIIALTAALAPQTHPAYAAAVAFMDAAGRGNDSAAFAYLDADMQIYARTCPEQRISACIEQVIPDEWGAFQSVVFRRALPDESTLRDGEATAYDVELIANYAADKGASGVCIHTRMEKDSAGQWRVAGYAGFVSCGDPASRSMAQNADAPNRAP